LVVAFSQSRYSFENILKKKVKKVGNRKIFGNFTKNTPTKEIRNLKKNLRPIDRYGPYVSNDMRLDVVA
jgi:hypothetical protein